MMSPVASFLLGSPLSSICIPWWGFLPVPTSCPGFPLWGKGKVVLLPHIIPSAFWYPLSKRHEAFLSRRVQSLRVTQRLGAGVIWRCPHSYIWWLNRNWNRSWDNGPEIPNTTSSCDLTAASDLLDGGSELQGQVSLENQGGAYLLWTSLKSHIVSLPQ